MSQWELFKEMVKRLVWSHTALYAFLVFFTLTVICLLTYSEFFK